MMPRLKAEEALADTERVALGSGSLKESDAKDRLARLGREARGEVAGGRRRTAARLRPDMVPGMVPGIGVRMIKTPAPPGSD